jgi:predicted enzyme related to lactoylglutathione lyase
MPDIVKTHFILYVHDQEASSAFYARVLNDRPTLQVPGMTEFEIGVCTVMGLMPERGIARLLGLSVEPASQGAARGEVYLVVADPDAYHQRALAAGARELSALAPRSWGDLVAYSLDPNGYVLAFACPTVPSAR